MDSAALRSHAPSILLLAAALGWMLPRQVGTPEERPAKEVGEFEQRTACLRGDPIPATPKGVAPPGQVRVGPRDPVEIFNLIEELKLSEDEKKSLAAFLKCP